MSSEVEPPKATPIHRIDQKRTEPLLCSEGKEGQDCTCLLPQSRNGALRLEWRSKPVLSRDERPHFLHVTARGRPGAAEGRERSRKERRERSGEERKGAERSGEEDEAAQRRAKARAAPASREGATKGNGAAGRPGEDAEEEGHPQREAEAPRDAKGNRRRRSPGRGSLAHVGDPDDPTAGPCGYPDGHCNGSKDAERRGTDTPRPRNVRRRGTAGPCTSAARRPLCASIMAPR